ncbi:calcium-binding protein [Parerythrobacter aestuarii]|uniref:calcium-binding protein n=1 Tax=Parerythrobacter aestuarii TaxID=3020909 RepID=UPI0024DEEE5C|nr:hypothetical protein [Parerythrobacter aestuarii]
MALNPTYFIINRAGISQDIIDLLLALADEAFRLWGAVLAGDADVAVRVELLDTTSSGRAQGGWGNGTNIGQLDGVNVIIGAPAHELQTGQNVSNGGHDIILQFSRDYLLNELFLDPTPQTRDDIPSDRTDGLSVLLHEIGHALGFIGYYNTDTNSQGNFATVYDLRRLDIAGEDYFRGPNVEALLGGDLELTVGNYTHYGNSNAFPGNTDDPLTGLMNGVVFYRGFAYSIGDLDLAVLADTGLGTILDDILENPLQTHFRGGLGNDRITGSEIDNFLFGDQGNDTLRGLGGSDELYGGAGADTLDGGDGQDLLNGGRGTDTIEGGSNIDTAVVSGNSANYTVTQTSTGVFEVSGPDGTDTLTGVEYLRFGNTTVRLLPGTGVSVNFETADPSVYQGAMNAIRDFDGNALGGNGSWLRIGAADVNGDGDIDQILVNDAIGRFATVGTAPDGLVYFDDYSWAGETRVAGIYVDPLVESGDVVAGSDDDSQQRFQNDLAIENINRVLGADDYDGDGLQEVYFALTDGTAYLHAYMHADGNIRYANYQSQQQVIDFLTANGYDENTWAGWFPSTQEEPGADKAEDDAAILRPQIVALTSFDFWDATPFMAEQVELPQIQPVETFA